VDVYALFTNTKSDLGANPNVVHEDAREEYLSLPDHEKDRLGYEYMLYQKLRDLVRGCDRIVNRSKDKLRVEKAQAAKARGAAGKTIDPATDVTEDMLNEAATVIADLELREEEVADMLEQLIESDQEWKMLWDQLQQLQHDQGNQDDDVADDKNATSSATDIDDQNQNKGQIDNEVNANDDNANEDNANEYNANKDNANKDNANEDNANEDNTNEDSNNINSNTIKGNVNDKVDMSTQIKEIKSKLYKISATQQKLISSISTITSQTIVPLRDNLQNLNKQLYYVKTDTSSDKSVCEVSGNTMSSRDAEERIAAHYAGKQYVGWKMVRDKLKELHKKYANFRPPDVAFGGGGGGGVGHGGYGPPPMYHGHPPPNMNMGPSGGFSRGGPPGYGGPPPQLGEYGGSGGYPNNGHGLHYGRERDRDFNNRSRGGGGDSSNHDRSRSRNQRRRSPSPPSAGGRWQRDRGYIGNGGRRRRR
jgi:hypothetical protein